MYVYIHILYSNGFCEEMCKTILLIFQFYERTAFSIYLLSSPAFWRLTPTVKKHVNSGSGEEMCICDVVIVCVYCCI